MAKKSNGGQTGGVKRATKNFKTLSLYLRLVPRVNPMSMLLMDTQPS